MGNEILNKFFSSVERIDRIYFLGNERFFISNFAFENLVHCISLDHEFNNLNTTPRIA
ncbi:hypothetical protein LEP1GSC125_2207 [Leptospira mayottensis 200901122]|uniref:Uncharacterized protein n=1 Tax=Leptospira mayottensis 200901122 TaxID=1193010 RepID=A0AA87MR66_9LEPT|nr:hypothetical protein LEP1GSC125_2207 [Leptospira mayottensis 200901122]